MIDVSPKFATLRYALAEGFLHGRPETLARIFEKTVPKGDVTQVARAAGILAAKRTSDWIVFCHPIPLDWVEVHVTPDQDRVRVTAEVRSVWKTGVEMEAITAVSAALLNAYDMLKPLDDTLSFGNIRVVKKRGGKSDYRARPNPGLTCAVLVISDSTHAGLREDKSGRIIKEFLEGQGQQVQVYEVLPDDQALISQRLVELVDSEEARLIVTTGGTGPGPKDLTPEATLAVIDKQLPGISEAIRHHGKERTPFAMHSRGVVGVRGQSLIINLPGSSNGAREGMEALFPGVLHAFPMMGGEGHEG
jgi:molybdenum cofactor biosynthesis protein MoaC